MDDERHAEPARPGSFATSSATTTELPVPGFLPAVVYLPAGSNARPLVVATHGAGGAPEWECEYWAQLTAARAVVLCLRGTPFDRAHPSSFFYRNHLELGRELEAALPALRAAHGSRLAADAGLYSGFSQGATMGVGMIAEHGDTLPYLVMIEGGYDYWSVARAKKYAAKGGKRVLFVCGTKWCADKSEKAAVWLRQAKLEARVEYAPGVGHTPVGGVMERVAAALPWVVEGDAAWALSAER